jgi:hypothetical protein
MARSLTAETLLSIPNEELELEILMEGPIRVEFEDSRATHAILSLTADGFLAEIWTGLTQVALLTDLETFRRFVIRSR